MPLSKGRSPGLGGSAMLAPTRSACRKVRHLWVSHNVLPSMLGNEILCVCVCVHAPLCVTVCLQVSASMCLWVFASICECVCLCLYICLHVSVSFMSVCVCASVCVCLSVCASLCVYVKCEFTHIIWRSLLLIGTWCNEGKTVAHGFVLLSNFNVSSSSEFPAICLGFIFCVWDFYVCDHFFNPAIEEVTFCLVDGACWVCFCCQHSPV